MIINNRITDEYFVDCTKTIVLKFKDGDIIPLKYLNRIKNDFNRKSSKIVIENCCVSPRLYQKFLSNKNIVEIDLEQRILNLNNGKDQEQFITMHHDCNMKIDRIRDVVGKDKYGDEQKYLEITLVGKVYN